MLAASSAREIEVVELTADEHREYLEEQCQGALGIGADEFARRWHTGEYSATDDPKVTQVATLLPDAW